MAARRLIASLLARLEGAFDRAASAKGGQADERAGGEFISTLIIDHGAAAAADEGTRWRGPRG